MIFTCHQILCGWSNQ